MEHKSIESIKLPKIYDDVSKSFDIQYLHIYTESELAVTAEKNANFFKEHNFLVLTNKMLKEVKQISYNFGSEKNMDYSDRQQRLDLLADRGRVGVKLGNLYIEYDMGGKNSFSLSVTLLDYKSKTSKVLISEVTQERFQALRLEDLIPFVPLYGRTSTAIGLKCDQQQSEKAHAIRDVLRKFALGAKVDKSEFFKVYTAFLAVSYLKEQHSQAKVSKVGKNNNTHLIEHIKELAEQLFRIYANQLIVTKEDVIKALKQYASKSGKAVDGVLLKSLLNTFVDQGRYPLHYLLDEINSEVQKEILAEFEQEIKSIHSEKEKQEIYTGSRNNVVTIFHNSRSVFSLKDLNPEEREQYLIEDIKFKLRADIQSCLGKFYGIAATSILGQSMGKAIGLPMDNFKYMKMILEWVDEDIKYKSLVDFYGKIAPFIDKLQPYGVTDFLNKARSYLHTIEDEIIKSQSKDTLPIYSGG